jgi:hypothetical protein
MKINRIRKFILLLFLGINLNSCSLIDPASPAAGYVYIDSFSLQTDYATQGSNSKKVLDAWVLLDNKYLGTFPLPATIPILGEGNHKISVKAGVLENGISGTRAAYPKYISFDTSFTIFARDTFKINPSITYFPGVTFGQIEDFDDASLTLLSTNSDYAPLVITQQSDPNSYEGNSGNCTLDSAHTFFEVASSTPFVLPLNVPSFLELNYKCDVDFSIGVFITTVNGIIKTDLISVRASAEWKKIYVTLDKLGAVTTDGIDEKIFIQASLGNTLSTANLYFDNLKVVY